MLCCEANICYTVKCLSRSTEGFYMYFYSVFFLDGGPWRTSFSGTVCQSSSTSKAR